MKNKLLTLGLFTGIFLTACNNHSSEKKQNVTAPEPPEANVTALQQQVHPQLLMHRL
jgi:hypothetical protein